MHAPHNHRTKNYSCMLNGAILISNYPTHPMSGRAASITISSSQSLLITSTSLLTKAKSRARLGGSEIADSREIERLVEFFNPHPRVLTDGVRYCSVGALCCRCL